MHKPKLWKRILAVILDLLLVSIPFSFVITSVKFGVSSFASQVIFFVLEVAYFSLLTYYWRGFTVGKWLMNIKVVSEHGTLTLQKSLYRFLVRDGLISGIPTLLTLLITPGLTNLVSFIVLMWFLYGMYKDSKQRGFHDRVSGTMVVSTKA